ncbi:tyrosine-type recombinase/integrase [Trichloromonas sp.]|uniref:tyrosine-type recombinase/integrase n=1 Tax=Trichloromonas sp. TaxID=3069249 RepID=UPI002A3E7727|nr:site-specific integrase [Trichloromonas sp.]
MASKDELFKTGEPGVFYREHPTRKHGVKKDRQWVVVQVLAGKRRVSTLGWWSQEVTLGDALNRAAEYRNNHKWNLENPDQPPRPICKQDEDDAAELKRQEIERARREQEHRNITFGEYFTTRYLPLQFDHGKKSAAKEEQLYRLHIAPILAKFSFAEIMPLHIEKIGKSMKDKGLSPKTIAYAYAVIRQAWNLANNDDVTDRQHPTRKVKKPKLNNKRERFISEEEETILLEALKKRSMTTHDMAIMSLDTGARWGELAALTWQNVDLEACTARLMDTKAGDNRTIHTTTARVKEMLDRRKTTAKSPFVFPALGGEMQKQTNVVFSRVVTDLGLNDGITDPRQKVCFHTLRHTFASRLAMAGVPLYTIARAMGHHTIAMTERYAHLAPDVLRDAMVHLEKQPAAAAKVVNLDDRR